MIFEVPNAHPGCNVADVEREAVYASGIPASRVANGLSDSGGRIRHLHAFRGFAILNIVLVHAFSSILKANLGHGDPSPAAKWIRISNEVLFHGSTIYFALISGLLFTIALRRRGWPRFFRNKLTNVIAPYAVMSLLFTLVEWFLDYRTAPAGNPPAALPGSYLSSLLHGTAQSSYWYIPVIVALFAATPLLDSLVTGRYAGIGIAAVASLPLFMSRAGVEVTAGTVIYFAGVYAFGMFLGEGYAATMARLRQWRGALAGVAATSTVALTVLFAEDIEMIGWVSLRESLFYIQKLSISGLLLYSMQQGENRLPRMLDQLATHAFSIYFLHLFVIKALTHFYARALPPPHDGGLIVALSLLLCGSTLALSWLISKAVQVACGRHSKWLIGA